MISLIMNTDGGSRGNPGQAACGAVIYDDKGGEVIKLNKAIGVATNNQAEYQALDLGLSWIKSTYGQAKVICQLDSELVVKQMQGLYKMKNAELKPWHEKISLLAYDLGEDVIFVHIPREKNQVADKLVNEALDRL